jgi:hypothetical protein
VGVKLLIVAVVALAVPKPLDLGAGYVTGRQQADGGFAEPGAQSDPSLTAWAILGLAAAKRSGLERAADYLTGKPAVAANDLALRIVALRAAGRPATDLVARLQALRRPGGRIGPLVNSTIWGVLALRATQRPAGVRTVKYLLRQQSPGGGWSWAPGGAPDSNDTAAAVQALRAAGVSGKPVSRGLAYLRRLENRDGGFALTPARASDTQSTAWAIQAFAAARRPAPRAAFRFLARMRRPDGSYRYSARYVTTPVWVTAQVLPALAGKAFPLPP